MIMIAIKMRQNKLQRDESGSALVEFALSATILLALIFGVLDCSRAMYIDHFVANAAREATRYAMVRGSSWKGASCTTISTLSCTAKTGDVLKFVESTMPGGFTTTNLDVATTWTGLTPAGVACSSSTDPGCVVTVKVSYSFGFNVPFVPAATVMLKSTAASTITQ
jgi:Flp pilus assembly protein TadG